MTAPDKIWATWKEDFGSVSIGTWADTIRFEHLGTEYIRADLHATLQAENERLREALQRIENASKFWSEYPDGNDAIRYAHESTHRLARAALK